MAKKQKAPKAPAAEKAPKAPAAEKVPDTERSDKGTHFKRQYDSETVEGVVPIAEALAPVAGKEELITEDSEPNTVTPVLVEMKTEELLRDQKIESVKKDWVHDPSLVKKVEGYKDTLAGTVYYGELK